MRGRDLARIDFAVLSQPLSYCRFDDERQYPNAGHLRVLKPVTAALKFYNVTTLRSKHCFPHAPCGLVREAQQGLAKRAGKPHHDAIVHVVNGAVGGGVHDKMDMAPSAWDHPRVEPPPGFDRPQSEVDPVHLRRRLHGCVEKLGAWVK